MYIGHLHYNITCTEKAICICESGYVCSTVYGILPHFEANACNMFTKERTLSRCFLKPCRKSGPLMSKSIWSNVCYWSAIFVLLNFYKTSVRVSFVCLVLNRFWHMPFYTRTAHTHICTYKQLAWCQRNARIFTKFGQHREHKYLEIELFNSALV